VRQIVQRFRQVTSRFGREYVVRIGYQCYEKIGRLSRR